MNAPCCPNGLGEDEGEPSNPVGDGEGTRTGRDMEFQATTAAGIKYAKPPAAADNPIAIAARIRLRKGLRRPRDAR